MVVRGIPISADFFLVDFYGELTIFCFELAHDPLRFTGLPEREAYFTLPVSNNLVSHFAVGGIFFLHLTFIVSRMSPVL